MACPETSPTEVLGEASLAARRRFAARTTVAMFLASVAAAVVYGPVPQPQAFHDYADRRTIFEIPNAIDVLSSWPFLLVGIAAVRAALRSGSDASPPPRWERLAFGVYGVGVALTAFASATYHRDPRDATLVFDRVPMTVAFSAFLALVLGERLGERVGRSALSPLVVAGLASVGYWAWSLGGAPGGDLRPYLLAKFFPGLAAVVLLLLVPEPRETRGPIAQSLALFAVATALEWKDKEVFRATGGLVSGHTLKHLVAAAAAACLLGWFARRRAARACPGTPSAA